MVIHRRLSSSTRRDIQPAGTSSVVRGIRATGVQARPEIAPPRAISSGRGPGADGRRAGPPRPSAAACGSVQQLHLRGEDPLVGTGGGPVELRDRPSDPCIAPVRPDASLRVLDHELQAPHRRWSAPAPDVMHSCRQYLPRAPRPKDAGRVGGVQVPPRELTLERQLVLSEDEHVDVVVVACLVPDVEVDRPPAGDPPGALQSAQDIRGPERASSGPTAPGSTPPAHPVSAEAGRALSRGRPRRRRPTAAPGPGPPAGRAGEPVEHDEPQQDPRVFLSRLIAS